MSAAASKLDTEKFRKVHVMMTGGATPGERSAAKARAEAIAAKAGMSLKDAVSSLSATPKPDVHVFDFGSMFDDEMEKKHPGYKAGEARKKAARNDRNAARRSEILAEFGTEAMFLARNAQEAALEAAIEPLVTEWRYWTDSDGSQHRVASEIGCMLPLHGMWSLRDFTPAARALVRRAIPWPIDLAGCLREAQTWDQLRRDRGLFVGEWENWPEVECRVGMLEDALESSQPAASWEDIQARFDWKRWEFSRQWLDPSELHDPFLDRLEADLAILRDLSAPELGSAKAGEDVQNFVPPLPRTTAEKRAAILSMLDSEPGLSSREIARRLGVSPQTVNTWRRKRRAA